MIAAMERLSWRKVLEQNDHALVAIRHGQTTYNVEGRCATITDVPLTERGRTEALEAAGSLHGVEVDRAFSSPRSRAKETAELMLDGSLENLVIDERRRRHNFREAGGRGGWLA